MITWLNFRKFQPCPDGEVLGWWCEAGEGLHFKMLLALFLSLANGFFRFFPTKLVSEITNYGIMLVLQGNLSPPKC